jgi:hypothetical protein
VGSSGIDKVDWMNLPMVERERCVPADSLYPSYRSCPRNWVDKREEDGRISENYFLAGAVRWAKEGEAANCRLVLNPENTEECVLISTLKTQSNSEWKLDRDYAHRMLGIGEYEYGQESLASDEESETSEVVATVEVARARRSVTAAEKLDREEETTVYHAQVLSYLEEAGKDRAALLCAAEIMKDSQEMFIIETRKRRLIEFSAISKGVFELMRIRSLGKSICEHLKIPVDEEMFLPGVLVVPESDEDETEGKP